MGGFNVLHQNKHMVASIRPDHKYFTEFTIGKAAMYTIASIYVIGTGIASIIEQFLNIPCTNPGTDLGFENPAYDGTRCPHIRHVILMGLTKEECSFGRRLVASILLGGLIGWERRQADRPAGIRTMSLVSLGSCLFTITSTFAFVNGPMNWDASRISAAIPSGVGFLGAGLIFKKEEKDASLVVHGLTTAASVWISAAVGIACGGELYFAASFGVAIMMLLLRFGPRSHDFHDDEDDDHHDGLPTTEDPHGGDNSFAPEKLKTIEIKSDYGKVGYGSTSRSSLRGDQDLDASLASAETAPMLKRPDSKSMRKRAALASVV